MVPDDADAAVSIRTYARMRGAAMSTIQQAVQDGRIRLTAAGLIHVAAADAGWYAAYAARQRGSGQHSPGRVTRARVAAGAARVQLASHRLAELEGAYVDRAEVLADARADLDQLRQMVGAMPQTEAAALAAELNLELPVAERLLDDFVAAVLAELGDPARSVDEILRRAG